MVGSSTVSLTLSLIFHPSTCTHTLTPTHLYTLPGPYRMLALEAFFLKVGRDGWRMCNEWPVVNDRVYLSIYQVLLAAVLEHGRRANGDPLPAMSTSCIHEAERNVGWRYCCTIFKKRDLLTASHHKASVTLFQGGPWTLQFEQLTDGRG